MTELRANRLESAHCHVRRLPISSHVPLLMRRVRFATILAVAWHSWRRRYGGLFLHGCGVLVPSRLQSARISFSGWCFEHSFPSERVCVVAFFGLRHVLVLMPCFLQFQQETCMAFGPNRPCATVGHMFVSYSRVFFDVSSARHRLRTTKKNCCGKNRGFATVGSVVASFFFVAHLFHCVSVSARILGMCSTRHHTIRTVQSWTASAVSEPATRRYRVQATAGDDQLPRSLCRMSCEQRTSSPTSCRNCVTLLSRLRTPSIHTQT